MPRTVLVVEDEPSLADLLSVVLEDEGYQVAVAGDGRAALARLAAGGCELVLSDVMLPFLDGAALALAMQADPVLRAIPLILMSAAPLSPARVVPHAAFLDKPFALDDLLATVQRLLDPDAGG